MSGLILTYHRVATPTADPFGMAVAPERFRAHVERLRSDFQPLSLDELLDGLAAGRLPERAVSVTFDDGYVDNAVAAAPVLRASGIPATVFIATGALGAESYWWDRLSDVLLSPGRLPRRLSLLVGRRPFRADLGEDRDYDAGEARRDRDWRAAAGPPPTRRHAVYLRLFRRCQRLSPALVEEALGRLEAWAGRPPRPDPARRPMTAAEVERLGAGPGVAIGGHSVSHRRLPKLSARERRGEIVGCRDVLEGLVDSVRHFAYPFGEDAGAAGEVEAAGFESACTTRTGRVTDRCDRFSLPRIRVGNWSGEELAHRLLRQLEADDDRAGPRR